MILRDAEIRALCLGFACPWRSNVEPLMIEPFSEGVQSGGVISYGLSHAGYDLRLGDKMLVFKNTRNLVVDPKRFKEKEYTQQMFDEVSGCSHFVIPPHSYVLAFSMELMRMPRWLKGRCVGKSTYARCGLVVNTTPVEPGWHGHLTIEIANTSPCPVVAYAGEGIAQMEFETLTGEPEADYGQKGGKYQDQTADPIPARIK